jgi:hypothetical protein
MVYAVQESGTIYGLSQRSDRTRQGRSLKEGFLITRNLASIACVVAAIGFVAGGAGVLISQAWWRPVIVATAAFSSMAFLLFWDGKLRRLNDQGALAILINLAILVAVLILAWPFP